MDQRSVRWRARNLCRYESINITIHRNNYVKKAEIRIDAELRAARNIFREICWSSMMIRSHQSKLTVLEIISRIFKKIAARAEFLEAKLYLGQSYFMDN